MAHENDVVKVFIQDRVNHVVDVRAQSNIGIAQMNAFTQSGQLWPVDIEALVAEQSLDPAPRPTASPGAVNNDDRWSDPGFRLAYLGICDIKGGRQNQEADCQNPAAFSRLNRRSSKPAPKN